MYFNVVYRVNTAKARISDTVDFVVDAIVKLGPNSAFNNVDKDETISKTGTVTFEAPDLTDFLDEVNKSNFIN